jgi:hypothetical protein
LTGFVKFIKDLVDSLSNQPGGFSLRKITALVTMICVVYIHKSYVDLNNAVSVVVYDMLFILLLFGVVTFDQLYKFKTGGSSTEQKPKEEEQKPVDTTNNDNPNGVV